MTDSDPQHEVRQLLHGAGGCLSCGRDVDDVLEQAADGQAGQLTEHQRDCPACQAALQEFSRLWEPVRRLAAEHVAVPAGVKAAVANRIGRLVSDVWYTLHLADAGALRVAARVVAKIARHAAGSVPGVEVAFGRSTRPRIADSAERATLRHHHPRAALGVLGSTAVIDLALAVHRDHQADAVAREVQRRAISAVRAKAGLDDITVNVTIDDVVT
ncbi:MAG TPA: Asp23/Gls24 family envelope stress response protein [Streptosporangiaceae bacterium]|nr:Asp23/Gls24 family envelope stress response protein [Streptosporangiaceae bacterium]